MRLTAELVRGAPAYMNALKERELSLRGFQIPDIENLGVTQDMYESIDLSENAVTRITNVPLLKRLHTLLLANNRISRIDAALGQFLPALKCLVLTNNKLSTLADLESLADLPTLTHVSLLGNPVVKVAHYREFIISKLPLLKSLDFTKIKPKEREAALKMFPPAEKKKEVKELKAAAPAPAKTFTPGESVPGLSVKPMGDEERAKLMERVANAKSLDEVDRLSKLLAAGKSTVQ